MAQLPQDLIVEIMVCMPVNSLLHFRCLSKSLYTLINSPNFINSHISKSSQNFNLRKLISYEPQRDKFHVYDLNENLENKILTLQRLSYFPGKISDNCRGLVLLHQNYYGSRVFALWNPSTRQFRDLPYFSMEAESKFLYFLSWGLGYDDYTDDYKVLIIVAAERKLKSETQVLIFGLKSNIWRRVQNFPYIDYSIKRNQTNGSNLPDKGCFTTDGSLHYLLCYALSNPMQREIVAFDMKKETFSLVHQPHGQPINGSVLEKLSVLEGCLCICYLISKVSGLTDQADLYVRITKNGVDHHDETFTWIKLFSVTKSLLLTIIDIQYWFGHVQVLGYSKRRDNILIEFGGQDALVSYDVEKKSFNKVEIDKDFSYSVILCLESLVSVRGSGTCIVGEI